MDLQVSFASTFDSVSCSEKFLSDTYVYLIIVSFNCKGKDNIMTKEQKLIYSEQIFSIIKLDSREKKNFCWF